MNQHEALAAHRLRELARDPGRAPYLVGLLLGGIPTSEYPYLVEATLQLHEEFGASGNDPVAAAMEAVALDNQVILRLAELLLERFGPPPRHTAN